ncbi:MAG: Tfp pilus assembly protein FimT/FimU [bacterium]
MRRAFHRAYTLIEVLIVVAILGLAAAILIPSMSGRGDFDTQAAVRALISDISFAQSDALANQGFRRIHFYDEGNGWCLLKLDEDQLGEPFDPATADYVADPLKGGARGGAYAVDFAQDDRFASVRIEGISIDGGRRQITFDELGGTVTNGGLPGTGGSLILRSPDAAYRLDLSPVTGKVRVTRLASAQ